MENKEIMVNEGVINTTEEIVDVGFGKGFKIAALVGLTVLVGGITYKYVVKPIKAKIKAEKEQQPINDAVEDDICDEDYNVSEEAS